MDDRAIADYQQAMRLDPKDVMELDAYEREQSAARQTGSGHEASPADLPDQAPQEGQTQDKANSSKVLKVVDDVNNSINVKVSYGTDPPEPPPKLPNNGQEVMTDVVGLVVSYEQVKLFTPQIGSGHEASPADLPAQAPQLDLKQA